MRKQKLYQLIFLGSYVFLLLHSFIPHSHHIENLWKHNHEHFSISDDPGNTGLFHTLSDLLSNLEHEGSSPADEIYLPAESNAIQQKVHIPMIAIVPVLAVLTGLQPEQKPVFPIPVSDFPSYQYHSENHHLRGPPVLS